MLWTVACQASLFMGFSRQEYWNGLPCPPPGYLPHPGIEPCLLCLLHWQAGSLPLAKMYIVEIGIERSLYREKKNLTNTSSAKLTKTISSVINHIQVCYLNMMFWRELKKKQLLELMSLARLWDIILIYETNLFVYTSNKQPDIEI